MAKLGSYLVTQLVQTVGQKVTEVGQELNKRATEFGDKIRKNPEPYLKKWNGVKNYLPYGVATKVDDLITKAGVTKPKSAKRGPKGPRAHKAKVKASSKKRAVSTTKTAATREPAVTAQVVQMPQH